MDELLRELKNVYGQDADFRDGQKEAIQDVLDGKRLLVIQKAGWGKSLVYFLATKILRKREKGITLIVSPLLTLMNNQVEVANKFGLCTRTINYENVNDWEDITEKLRDGTIDVLIVSPERLSNPKFKKLIIDELSSQIDLFVVDEAHCISDWGHDFKPDYRRVVEIINMLPSNIPILATTATANDRVVNDIKDQLGDDLIVSRGSLIRKSLSIQVIEMKSKEERMAWILHNINTIPGTGIIFCLTIKDCELVNKWLNENGINSECYFAALDTEKKHEVVASFMNNSIKVLVATSAFGMGFDKSDIGFVIHFQKPGNLMAYYQQIGRAGRGLSNAYVILLSGDEDAAINKVLIDSACPTEELMGYVVNKVTEIPGITISKLQKYVNMKSKTIKSCVKYLVINGDIYVDNKKYYKTPREWKPNLEKSKEITEIRREELLEMEEFTKQRNCYMEYIAKKLDDSEAVPCGKCANCVGHPLIKTEFPEDLLIKAQKFIKEDFKKIKIRKRWPIGEIIEGGNRIPEEWLCETGRVLSNYDDAGWGKCILAGKNEDDYFDDQLVEASKLLLEDFIRDNEIVWVTSVPSIRRPELVKSFAERLASKLGLQYYDSLEKVKNSRCQRELFSSQLKCDNVYNSFEARIVHNENVLLVDDIVDSRWTFTVCGYKLRKKGSGKVFPFALVNCSGGSEEE